MAAFGIIPCFTLVEMFDMPLLILLLWLLFISLSSCAQQSGADTSKLKVDSLLLYQVDEQQLSESDAILMNEQERSSAGSVNNASPLYAEKDIFQQTASFQFSTFRFRARGYESSFTTALINGLVFNQPEDGNPAWSLWSGLQTFMRNSDEYLCTRFHENWIGTLGSTGYTDMRAMAQRPQFQLLYGSSNRSYQNRYQYSFTSNQNKRGWTFSVATTYRSAEEGFNTAAAFESLGYYFAADKQLKRGHVLSIMAFGNKQYYGKQAAITMPVATLFGNRYNPNWGYQQGEKRNAATATQHKPVLILTHEWQPNNQTMWRTSLGFVVGRRSDTGLDWFQAADPRPDYYRYLPAYQTDSLLSAQVQMVLSENDVLRQINWQKLYEINHNSFDRIENVDGIPGKVVMGKRARYLLEERVKATRLFLFSSSYQQRINANWQMSTGIHFRFQQNHFYKKVMDLLGADFHVNHNQFAESDLPTDRSILQYNIDRPDQILYKGDRYGYDYNFFYAITDGWMQAEKKGKKFDFFSGMHLSKQTFYRKGMIRNGLFPDQSKGSAVTNHFFNATMKAALTYKPSVFQSVILFLTIGSRPPIADNIYISPRMRNTKQNNVVSEQINSLELMYRLVLPKIHFRISAYHSMMSNGMNVLTFYHDGYRNFVNYAISNIDRKHSGVETGFSFSFNENWQVTGAAAMGYHRYTSRQQVTVSLDNNEFLLDKMEVYTRNFRVAGSPQWVLGSGIQYKTANSFFLQLNWNYFDQRWLEFNPVRRTYDALQGVQPTSEQWNKIIMQTKLPTESTINLFIGKGFSIPSYKQGKRVRYFCVLSVQNLLNKKDMITGGYEQLRFDQETKNIEKFPPKLFFGNGINYAVSISMSL